MSLASRRVWVGSMTLSSVLLLSSLAGVHNPALASLPTTSLKTVALTPNALSGYSAAATRNKIITSAEKTQIKKEISDPKVQVAEVVKQPDAKTEAGNQPKQVASTNSTKQQTQVSRSSSTDSSMLIRNAMSLQGIPYVFGGTSRSGFDCSGYTQYVFKGSGVNLPRTSYDQYGVGSAVSRDQLQPGDLVFFSTYAKGASHVGIYVGGGNFMHASNSGVRTTSLSDSYYASRYVGAKRVSN